MPSPCFLVAIVLESVLGTVFFSDLLTSLTRFSTSAACHSVFLVSCTTWITFILSPLASFLVPKTLQQRRPILTKSSEENLFCHQIWTFSDEIYISSPNMEKGIKLLMKWNFCHHMSQKILAPILFLSAKRGRGVWRRNISSQKGSSRVTNIFITK